MYLHHHGARVCRVEVHGVKVIGPEAPSSENPELLKVSSVKTEV